jgi:Haem-binding uptake, Tiki superfamily, ChaN
VTSCFALLCTRLCIAQAEYSPLVEGIVSGWNQADLVCLGEHHGSKQDSDLRIALVRNPQFARIVKLIVVEFANPVHQDVLDRFVLDGAEVPHEELASVWRDSSSPGIVWESPVYESFLRAVREVNQRLPFYRQRIRVIGGDSPIDWKKITTPQQLAPLLNRNGNIRNILAQKVLEKHVKSLAIYGAAHCEKSTMGFPYALSRIWSISSLRGPRNWKAFELSDKPAYINVSGTKWASLPSSWFDSEAQGRFGDLLDAIVWYGDTSDVFIDGDTTELEAKYGTELERRARLIDEVNEITRRKP